MSSLLNTNVVFTTIIFFAVFMFIFGLLALMFGGNRKNKKIIKQRIDRITHEHTYAAAVSLQRQQYLHSLSPVEQFLETLPGMAALRKLIEQANRNFAAYQVAALCLILFLGAAFVTTTIINHWLLALLAGSCFSALPLYWLNKERNKQMALFEEQLPDALDSITRAIKVGHPFNDAMRMISQEMNDPIAKEFAITSAEINYGSDFKSAMINLLERKPSVSLMALVASVLIQRETGGNLSEVISNLSGIIRSRFQLRRKVKTLSAEGRLSAWILLSLPFVLGGVIHMVNPEYLLPLFREPLGQKLLIGSGCSIVLGVIWINRIIKIDF
ncbi:MAG: type II secretion system F family protein [Thiolinea sp.]